MTIPHAQALPVACEPVGSCPPVAADRQGGAIELNLPFPPSINSMFKNVPGQGRALAGEYEAWKVEAGWALKAQRPRKASGRVIITIDIDDRRRGDCSNRSKSVEDLLVTHGVIPDDSKAHVRRVSIGWESVDGCRVRVEAA